MKKIQIYIDNSDMESEFVKKLTAHLIRIKSELKILSYNDLDKEYDFDNNDAWEDIICETINESDIILTILSPDYLNEETLTEKVDKKLEGIADLQDKYLIPILYRPTNWTNIDWISRTKIFPDEAVPLSELKSNDYDKSLIQLTKKIEGIIAHIQQKEKRPDINNLNFDSRGKVFISHSHNDSDFAELLKLRLEKEGVEAWIDSERLKIGQDWREEIDVGIKNSMAIIAVMTPQARTSEYVTYEWSFAWGCGKKVLPILLDQTQLHPRLESLQYLDFTNKGARPWNELIESLKVLKHDLTNAKNP